MCYYVQPLNVLLANVTKTQSIVRDLVYDRFYYLYSHCTFLYLVSCYSFKTLTCFTYQPFKEIIKTSIAYRLNNPPFT